MAYGQCSLAQDIFRDNFGYNILGGHSERYDCMLQSTRLANMKEQVGSWSKTVGLELKSGTSRVGGHSANLQSVFPVKFDVGY